VRITGQVTPARLRAALGLVLVAGMTLVLSMKPGGDRTVTCVGDLATAAAAIAATAAAGWRGYRTSARLRSSWLVLTAALGSTSIGEVIWAWTEVVGHRTVPSPGLTDVFYLAFYPLALVGLALRPGRRTARGERLRNTLEALLVTASFVAISAVSVLGPLTRQSGSTDGALAVVLAYPIGDVLLLSTVAFFLSGHFWRRAPGLLAAGLGIMGLADSLFTALATTSFSALASLTDVGYVVAYLLLAEAALRDVPTANLTKPAPRTRLVSNVPLVPALCALGVGSWQLLTGTHDLTAGIAVTVVMAMLLIRQLASHRENSRLLSAVLAQHEQLQQQAYHDALTGLANRVLFADRLHHAVEVHRRDLTPITILLIDLDDFKQINDTLGHSAGDDVLVTVAERLRAPTRRADTVARLGGDEFAILIEGDLDPWILAERLLATLREPTVIRGRTINVSASVGIATLGPDERPIGGDELLIRADVAMYEAKNAGKSTAMTYSAKLVAGEAAPTPVATRISVRTAG
jgi:diguanylate cyclase (GGDEF)-like protein